uniref:Uncharacterized protein n=1 Tax=Mus spicilegus TaxID=10103 RepID=A0A8C6HE50_MUSSI
MHPTDHATGQANTSYITETERTQREENSTHLDPRTPTFGDRIWHCRPRRVNHGQKPHKAEIGSGKVYGVYIKCVALGKLICWQVEVTETWKRKGVSESRIF